ncbi:MAG: hypothetical protein QXW79_03145 [Thermoplasmata archaeon]
MSNQTTPQPAAPSPPTNTNSRETLQKVIERIQQNSQNSNNNSNIPQEDRERIGKLLKEAAEGSESAVKELEKFRQKYDFTKLIDEIGLITPTKITRGQRFANNTSKVYEYPDILFRYKSNKAFHLIEYVKFQPVEFIPPYSKPFSSAANSENVDESRGVVSFNSYHSVYNGDNYKPVDATVLLPMPENIETTYSNAWNEARLSYTGRMIIDAGIKLLESGINETELAARLQEVASGGGLTNLAAEVAARSISALGQGNDLTNESILGGAMGVIPNPNIELLFGLPQLRKFTFNYKLIAMSEKDANQIRKIISLFKRNMFVTLSVEATGSTPVNPNRYVGAPNLFDIKFMRGSDENAALFRIKKCALESFSINFSGSNGGYNSVLSSKNFIPFETNISMSFIENKILYSEDVSPENDSFFDSNAGDIPY